MNTPLVSIIIATFNHSQFLRMAVGSAIDQTYSNIEIIVVDDGSTDETAETLKQIHSEYDNHALTTIRQRNGGLANARNTGIRVARGEYIQCLDADDYLFPHAVHAMSQILQSRQDVDVVRPYLEPFHEVGQVPPATPQTSWGEVPYDYQAHLIENIAPYCSMFRRAEWERVGGYSEDLPAYEDWEFWLKVGASGADMAAIPEPLVHYRVSSEGMYAQAAAHDDAWLKAVITVKHSEKYPPELAEKARQFLEKHPMRGQTV